MGSSWWNDDWQESDEEEDEAATGVDKAEDVWTTAAPQETWQEDATQTWRKDGVQAWQEVDGWQHDGEEDEQVTGQTWEDEEWHEGGWGADDEY